jgi:hypothetical protein
MNTYKWSTQQLTLENSKIYVPSKLYFEYIYKEGKNIKEKDKDKLLSTLLKSANKKDFEKMFLLEYSKKYQYKKSKFYNIKKLILKILDFRINFKIKSNFYIHIKKYERACVV